MAPLQDEGCFEADAAPVSARLSVRGIGEVAYGEFHYDSPDAFCTVLLLTLPTRPPKQAQIHTAASSTGKKLAA